MKKIILYLGLLISIGSCGPNIYFEQSQPINIEKESIFPKSLQGIYIDDKNDDFILIIDELTCEYRNKKVKGVDILGSFSKKGQLSDSIILKNHEDHYFLNLKGDNEWYVIFISVQEGKKLTANFLDGENEDKVEKLKKITPVKEIFDINGDIDRFVINPTSIELEKMLKRKMFSGEMTFTKQQKKE